jgi:hypothetical protein
VERQIERITESLWRILLRFAVFFAIALLLSISIPLFLNKAMGGYWGIRYFYPYTFRGFTNAFQYCLLFTLVFLPLVASANNWKIKFLISLCFVGLLLVSEVDNPMHFWFFIKTVLASPISFVFAAGILLAASYVENYLEYPDSKLNAISERTRKVSATKFYGQLGLRSIIIFIVFWSVTYLFQHEFSIWRLYVQLFLDYEFSTASMYNNFGYCLVFPIIILMSARLFSDNAEYFIASFIVVTSLFFRYVSVKLDKLSPIPLFTLLPLIVGQLAIAVYIYNSSSRSLVAARK